MTFDIPYAQLTEVSDYWQERLPMCACEEMGELIQAISKRSRGELGSTETVAKEMADVIISIAALCEYYDISSYYVNECIKEKMKKKY